MRGTYTPVHSYTRAHAHAYAHAHARDTLSISSAGRVPPPQRKRGATISVVFWFWLGSARGSSGSGVLKTAEVSPARFAAAAAAEQQQRQLPVSARLLLLLLLHHRTRVSRPRYRRLRPRATDTSVVRVQALFLRRTLSPRLLSRPPAWRRKRDTPIENRARVTFATTRGDRLAAPLIIHTRSLPMAVY